MFATNKGMYIYILSLLQQTLWELGTLYLFLRYKSIEVLAKVRAQKSQWQNNSDCVNLCNGRRRKTPIVQDL